jgi:hypothetical protein
MPHGERVHSEGARQSRDNGAAPHARLMKKGPEPLKCLTASEFIPRVHDRAATTERRRMLGC